jgi:DnaK suppressor protein
MDLNKYRTQLLDLERELSARAGRLDNAAREQVPDTPVDSGDESVIDEAESEDFTEAELDATVLQQVRSALDRINDGTFGRCAADDQPIPEKRLDAVPYARYCAKHQALLEAASGRRTPTL